MAPLIDDSSLRILVSGNGPVAAALLNGLRSAGRSAGRLEDPCRTGAALKAAALVLLADDEARFGERLDEVAAHLDIRSSRLPPLRVILAFTGGSRPHLYEPDGATGLTLEYLDLEKGFARSLFARRPIHAGMDPAFGQVPHLLFAGHAPPIDALWLQAMRLAHYGDRPSVLSFACADPEARRRSLFEVYPEAPRLARLAFVELEEPDLEGLPPVTSVFVCTDPPEEGLDSAYRLARLIARRQAVSPEIHLEVGDAEPSGDLAAWDGQIIPFSWLREVCRPEVWLDGHGDELAQVVHDHYRDSIAAQGRNPADEPAGHAWDDLDASYRDANRFQADHLWAKLALTDCRAVPEELVESFAFAPLEVERLSVIEHARWAADRYLNGWTYAPERDNVRKHHPQLIPYAELSEPMKDLDRFAVRLVPVLLARSGRGVVRMLIVGMPEAGPEARADSGLSRLSSQILERLVQRYPDRSLVMAATLADAPSRLVVHHALEQFSAGLFLLCPRPIGETLAAQSDSESREDLLGLAARAERRICLGGGETLKAWLALRAEVLLCLGGDLHWERPVKRVVLEAGAEPVWNFDY